METFDAFVLQQIYNQKLAEKDKLQRIKAVVDWEKFRPMIDGLYKDNTVTGGRPHLDSILMVRIMILQSLYNLSDPAMEYQLQNMISFMVFVGFDTPVPDFTSIWRFRDRLAKAGLARVIFEEFLRQVEEKGYDVKVGVIQDATFVEGNIGKKRRAAEYKKKNEGKEVLYTKKQKQHMDQDGTFSIKGKETHYGYKTHVKTDIDNGFVREVSVTTASTHDSKINLIREGDLRGLRDRGYTGTKLPEAVEDLTMKKAKKNHPISEEEKKFNKLVSKTRCLIERTFASVKVTFGRAGTKLNRLIWVQVQQTFNYLAFNMATLARLELGASA